MSLMSQEVLSRVQARWLRQGFFQSINPTIQYTPGKANIVVDALSRSRSLDPGQWSQSPDPDHGSSVAALTQSPIVPTEELTAWKIAQEGDPVLRQILYRIHAGIECNTFQINTHGLLVSMDASDGSVKLMVPSSMRQEVIQSCHDVPVAGHVDIHRTQEVANRQFSWRGMGTDIQHYVRTCPVCQTTKSDHQKTGGALQPLPVPSGRWEQITTDLCTDLPMPFGYTAIAVFVDRLSKMVHFAPCKEITAEGYAQLFIDTVFRRHGVPKVIISDRDPPVHQSVLKSLMNQLGADARYSTVFHPPTDGQSEVTIRVMENFNRPYVERYPASWSIQLSIVELATNNVVNASTGYTPFYLNTAMHPVVPSSLLMAFTLSTTQESVSERVTRLKDAIHHAQEQLKAA